MNFRSFLYTLALCLFPLCQQTALAENITTSEQLEALAREMTADILTYRKAVKVGLRPFFKGETTLNPRAADKLYLQLYSALNKYKGFGDLRYIDQRHMQELLQTREEYYMANPNKLLETAQADIQILCHPQSLDKALRLSCIASDLQTAVTYSTREIEIPFDLSREGAINYHHALENLAKSLSVQVADLQSIYPPVILDLQTGGETEITQLLGRRLVAALQQQVASNYRQTLETYQKNSMLNDVHTPPAPPHVKYRMRGALNKTDEKVYELHIILQRNDQIIASARSLINAASLAKTNRTDDGNSPQKIYSAIGEAAISRKLNRKSARHGAVNLARARVVSQASGLPAPPFQKVTTQAEAALILLHSLKYGIPIDERIIDITAPDSNHITVELYAKVKAVGTWLSPKIKAKLNKTSYQAGDKIQFSLAAPGHTNIGIYGWFADGRIVRIYPDNQYAAVSLSKDTPLILPRRDEPPLITAPMPVNGNSEDQEAIMIIASNQPAFDFKSLAPYLGQSLNQTMEKAATADGFFDRLGQMDTSRISLTILPYQVHH